MKIKIGINGMGRIGRMILRSIFEENKNGQVKKICSYNHQNPFRDEGKWGKNSHAHSL